MPNNTLTLSRRLTDSELGTIATVTVAAPYQARDLGRIDVPDTTVADTEYPLAFGSCAEAVYCEVQNETGQDIAVRMGGDSVTGTLVEGTATIAFAAAPGERLSVEAGDDNGGTPGVLSVKRSAGNVIVQSWLVGTGIEAADVSDVTVYNNAPPLLPDGGVMLIAAEALGTGIASATAILSDVQAGEGIINTIVCGDPI
jgi:hypothetical protein